MAKAPTKTVKRVVRRAAPVQPRNMSRAAGAPAPESAAATAPRSGFYDPDGGAEAQHVSALQSATERLHAASVRSGAIDVDEVSTIDIRGAEAVLRDGGEEEEREETLEEAVARVRGMRKPLGAYTQKLALAKRSGYHTHWFNDEGGRIDDALANGWVHRKDSENRPYRRAVGRGRDAGVLYAYAMDLPEVFWLEDMSARHKVAAEKIEALKANPIRAERGKTTAQDGGKFYSPVEDALTVEKS